MAEAPPSIDALPPPPFEKLSEFARLQEKYAGGRASFPPSPCAALPPRAPAALEPKTMQPLITSTLPLITGDGAHGGRDADAHEQSGGGEGDGARAGGGGHGHAEGSLGTALLGMLHGVK